MSQPIDLTPISENSFSTPMLHELEGQLQSFRRALAVQPRHAIKRARRASRFRPVYYTLRLLECSAWGLEPSRWYLARQVLFAVTVFTAV